MATRMVPFIYSSTIAYAVEFGEYYISFFYDGALLAGTGATIESPYLQEDLPELNIRQVGDTMWITHEEYKPRKLTRTTTTTFSLDIITFTTGPFLTRNDIAKDDGVTMAYTGTLTKDAVGTLTCSAAHFESGHVGAIYQLTHSRLTDDCKVSTTGADDSAWLDVKGNYTLNTHGFWTGTVELLRKEDGHDEEVKRTFISANDRNVQFTSTEREYDVAYKIGPLAGMSDAFGADITANVSTKVGVVRIDSITSATVAVCTVLHTIGGTSGLATKRWAEGAWSGVQGYPKTVAFFADRCMYAGNRSIWLSRVGRYEYFDTGVLADDSFTVDLATTNEIMWIDTVDEVIVIGTTGLPFTLKSNKIGSPLTPTNWTADPVAGYGSANIQGVKVDNAILYVDLMGKKIVEFGYNADELKYRTPDMTVLAEHATLSSTITWIAHQKNPESILWFGMADGTLHSLTYNREQNVIAYAPHPTTGNVKSGCIIPGDGEDEVWFTVERELNSETTTCVERMWPRTLDDDDDAHFVDCGVVYDGMATTSITGLDHLEGETVAILADGEAVAPQVVSGGSITLADAASKVHVGLPFTPVLKPMRLDIDTKGGSTHGSIANIPELVLSLKDSDNVAYGDSASALYDIDLTDVELVNTSEVTGLFSGDVTLHQAGGFSVDDAIVISSGITNNVVDPTPLTVRAIVARKEVTGR